MKPMNPLTTFVAPLSVSLPRHQLTAATSPLRITQPTLPVRRAPTLHSTIPHCSAQTASITRLREEIANLVGVDRGIFGLEDSDRASLDALIRTVEAETPTSEPTANNAQVAAGAWRLIYTNLEILGRRRIKLAIGSSRKSGLVKLGDILQIIDAEKGESRNVVEFDVMGRVGGTFTIDAGYEVESGMRVRVVKKGERLEPEKLEMMLGENVGLLTEIFNPEGWLDITYVDRGLRIGRDGKGRVFVLERVEE